MPNYFEYYFIKPPIINFEFLILFQLRYHLFKRMKIHKKVSIDKVKGLQFLYRQYIKKHH